MSSPISFEVLREISEILEDGLVDEDIQDIETSHNRIAKNRHVMNRIVTTRGRHQGRGVVLQYADRYTESFSTLSVGSYEREMLEIFVSQSRVTFEGVCKRRGVLGKLARLVGSGGLEGDHPMFRTCWVDATDPDVNVACFANARFCEAVDALAHTAPCSRVKLQAGGGLCPVLHFEGALLRAQGVVRWLDLTIEAAAALDT